MGSDEHKKVPIDDPVCLFCVQSNLHWSHVMFRPSEKQHVVFFISCNATLGLNLYKMNL